MPRPRITKIEKSCIEFSTITQNQGGRFSVPAVVCRAANARCGSALQLEVQSRKGSWKGIETLRSGEEIVARKTSPLLTIAPARERLKVTVQW